ncbi:MAG TPA: outer membrane beta-barrel protein [Aggregicoccus sp.]|nr:outer membrane beta-barrel protein [Aggregicoccus sp.]
MRHLWMVPAALLTASAALASGEPHTHDGFYLRLQAGPGGVRANNGDEDLTLKGLGGGLNVEIGGALARNFILYGKLFGASVPSPDLKLGGVTFEDVEDVNLGVGAVGVGATYYFMPVNLYVSAAISAAQLSLETADERGETKVGPGLHLGLGKEWWVGEQWGLGVGAELALARVEDKNVDSSWNTGTLLVLFSATFN